jgi:hypothetical protein
VTLVLTFDGLTFDANAVSGLTLSALTGWWDGPAPRLSLDERPQDDGSFSPGRVFKSGKVVTVEGSFVGSSLLDAQVMRRRLAAIQQSGLESDFTVQDDLGSFTVSALLSAAVVLPDDLFSPFFTFSFAVSSASAYKFGPAVTASTGLATSAPGITFPVTFPITFGTAANNGQVTSSNPGTARSWPVFSVTGQMTGGFLLTNTVTAQRIQLVRDIPLTSVVSIDSRNGQAFIDGSPIPGYLTRAEWWSVPPGGSSTVQFTALGVTSGSPTLTVTVKPAYL